MIEPIGISPGAVDVAQVSHFGFEPIGISPARTGAESSTQSAAHESSLFIWEIPLSGFESYT